MRLFGPQGEPGTRLAGCAPGESPPPYGVQVKPLVSIENARTLPVSKNALSATFRVHVPFESSPPNASSSEVKAVNVPVNGACEAVTFWIELAAVSSSTV